MKWQVELTEGFSGWWTGLSANEIVGAIDARSEVVEHERALLVEAARHVQSADLEGEPGAALQRLLERDDATGEAVRAWWARVGHRQVWVGDVYLPTNAELPKSRSSPPWSTSQREISSTRRYTGRHVGAACFAQGKVVRVQEWLERSGLDLRESWFYSDSRTDLPLLEAVTHAVAVDPDAVLEAEARRRAWPVVSLR